MDEGFEWDPLALIRDGVLVEQFVRASGPGGQNVNKVSTAVQIHFDPRGLAWLDDDARARLARLAGRRMTGDGLIVIDARRHRTRERNREDARERLRELLVAAMERPRVRRATRPSKGAKQRRLDEKQRRAGVKRTRGRVDSREC